MQDIDELIDKKTKNVKNMDDYVMIRALLACRQERDNIWFGYDADSTDDEQGLYDRFMHVKLLLRRIEFGLSETDISEVIQWLCDNTISPYLIYDIIHTNYENERAMQDDFSRAFFEYCEEGRYKSEFIEHTRRVEFYDIDI